MENITSNMSKYLARCSSDISDIEQHKRPLVASVFVSASSSSSSGSSSTKLQQEEQEEIRRDQRYLSEAISAGLDGMKNVVRRIPNISSLISSWQPATGNGLTSSSKPLLALSNLRLYSSYQMSLSQHSYLSDAVLQMLDSTRFVPSDLRLRALTLVFTLMQPTINRSRDDAAEQDEYDSSSSPSPYFSSSSPSPAVPKTATAKLSSWSPVASTSSSISNNSRISPCVTPEPPAASTKSSPKTTLITIKRPVVVTTAPPQQVAPDQFDMDDDALMSIDIDEVVKTHTAEQLEREV